MKDIAAGHPFIDAWTPETPQQHGLANDLPFDVLSLIFKSVQDASAGVDEWLVVSEVNRHWREAALQATELWTRLSFDGRHGVHGVHELLARSKERQGLDLTFDLSSYKPVHAWLMLREVTLHHASARLRNLTIRTMCKGYKALDQFLGCLTAPNLESLTLEDGTAGAPCPVEGDELYRMLPDLPKLKELRVRGLLFRAVLSTHRQLSILEISNVHKYETSPDLPEELDEYLDDILNECTNLEELVLRRILLVPSLEDLTAVALPRLRRLEILDEETWPSTILKHLEIPEAASIHLHTRLHPSAPEEVLMYDPPISHPPFQRTAAVAFHANANHTLYGWTNSHVSGPAAWSVTGDMALQRMAAQRALLRISLFELPGIVDGARLAHLAVHISPRLPTYAQDWRSLLCAFPALRVLRVGGEHAAWAMLRALPASGRPRVGGAVLPRGLHELELCVRTLGERTCEYVAARVRKVPVLSFRLPVEAYRVTATRRANREARRRLQALLDSKKHRGLRMRTRVDYGERCTTCHSECTPYGGHAPGHAHADEGCESSEPEPDIIVLAPWAKAGSGAVEEWTSVDDPDQWSASSEDTEPEAPARPEEPVRAWESEEPRGSSYVSSSSSSEEEEASANWCPSPLSSRDIGEGDSDIENWRPSPLPSSGEEDTAGEDLETGGVEFHDDDVKRPQDWDVHHVALPPLTESETETADEEDGAAWLFGNTSSESPSDLDDEGAAWLFGGSPSESLSDDEGVYESEEDEGSTSGEDADDESEGSEVDF